MNVLVVDDTKNIRTLLTKCLELCGYTVKTAENGHAALRIIEEERFDLVFLDIKMPTLSGTEVLKRMRDIGVNTPVIIITAYATVKNAIDCTQLGAVAYLQKPFTADKIKNVLNELLKNSKSEPENSNQNQEHNLKTILDKADSLIESHDYTAASLVLREALPDYPFSSKLYSLLSSLSEKQGDIEAAQNYRKLYKALR